MRLALVAWGAHCLTACCCVLLCRYLINGATVQLGRVTNLFHSVQLNVNNPHFLIMQGRITKVINMKPPEVRARVCACAPGCAA